MSPELDDSKVSEWVEQSYEANNDKGDKGQDRLKSFYIDKDHGSRGYEFSEIITISSKFDKLEIFSTALVVGLLFGFTFFGDIGLLLGGVVGSLFGTKQILGRVENSGRV